MNHFALALSKCSHLGSWWRSYCWTIRELYALLLAGPFTDPRIFVSIHYAYCQGSVSSHVVNVRSYSLVVMTSVFGTESLGSIPSRTFPNSFFVLALNFFFQATRGKQVESFFSLPHYLSWKKQLSVHEQHSWKIKYYKVLCHNLLRQTL